MCGLTQNGGLLITPARTASRLQLHMQKLTTHADWEELQGGYRARGWKGWSRKITSHAERARRARRKRKEKRPKACGTDA